MTTIDLVATLAPTLAGIREAILVIIQGATQVPILVDVSRSKGSTAVQADTVVIHNAVMHWSARTLVTTG